MSYLTESQIEKLVRSNKKWWTDRLLDRELTYRSFAAKIGLAGPDVSRIINSQRNVKAEEAVLISKVLKVPLEDVVSHGVAHAPIQRYERKETKDTSYTKVVGWADMNGQIIRGAKGRQVEKNVLRPAKMTKDAVALRIMTPGPFQGVVAYFYETDIVHEKAMHNRCVVTTKDGRELLRFVSPGKTARDVTLMSLDFKDEERTAIKSAAPIIWFRPELN